MPELTRPRSRPSPETETDWDVFWSDKAWVREHLDTVHLAAHQRVNHFRNHYELTRKDMLAKNLKRARRVLAKQARRASSEVAGDRAASPRPHPSSAHRRSGGGHALAALGSRPEDFDFFPETYTLPSEYLVFVKTFKVRAPAGAVWIMKPVGRCQGRGIFLFDKLSAISEWREDHRWSRGGAADAGGAAELGAAACGDDEAAGGAAAAPSLLGGVSGESSSASSSAFPAPPAPAPAAGGEDGGGEAEAQAGAERYVVQRYIPNPLLVGGKKFDLRIYVLVTSYSPLRVYLYREGFARFSGSRFSMDARHMTNTYVHLTNVAVQKRGDEYDARTGGKWGVHELRSYLASKHGEARVGELFEEIKLVVLRSLASVQPVIINSPNSFELYGYDVLIDAVLKVWLIEVNASPSFSASTAADRAMKRSIMHDTLNVLDVEGRLAGGERRVGGFDLVHDRNGLVPPADPAATVSCFLGCRNDRERQLRSLYGIGGERCGRGRRLTPARVGACAAPPE